VKRTLLSLTIASLALVAHSSLAEEAQSIDTTLVTGSRIGNTQAIQAVTLDASAIELRASANAVDMLRGFTGLDVIQPGGPGGVTELFIRGAESNFALVTIDGVRVNDITNSRGGSFDLSSLNPDDIERVEILKGPLSAIYGSDALAGALNIVTKKPSAEPQVSLRATGGTDGYKRGYLSASGTLDNGLGASLSVAHLDAGEPVKGSTSESDSIRGQLLWGNEQRQLDLTLGYVERDRTSYPTASGGPLFAALDDLEKGTAEDTSAQAGWREQLSDALLFDVRGSWFKREEQLDVPAILEGVYSGQPAQVSDSEMERSRLVAYGVYNLSSNLSLAFGADYEKEEGRANSLLNMGFPLPSSFDLKRENTAAFLEANFQSENGMSAFISARVDKPEDMDRQTSSKIAWSYLVAENTRFGVSWGDAFKLPSFYSLGDTLVGNADLLSEESETYEIYLHHGFDALPLRLNASLFHSDYDHLIDFDFATFKLVNRDSVEVKGGELEFIYTPIESLEIGLNATHTDYDTRINGRADWRGALSVQWTPVSDWQARLQVSHTGDRPSASTPTGDVDLDSYQRVDAVVTRRINDQLSFTLSLDNLLDKEYQEEVGFPSAGFAARFGVSIKL
jgi:vitamin B12 transporter